MTSTDTLNTLRTHLQTAIDVELSTIPIYLYTYYSVNRMPSGVPDTDRGDQIATFANKAGGIIMSVAIEEMLHLSLVSNILKSLGGQPAIYGRAPGKYPTNLEDHSVGFSIGLTRLSAPQLKEFMDVEQPAPTKEEPQCDHWDTLGQFYECVSLLINQTSDSDYTNPEYQLADDKGYYASSNVDTVYPKDAFYIKVPENPDDPSARGSNQAQYPNNDDSGGLRLITCKQDALDAITEISEQGEGFRIDPDHKYDDKDDLEDSHWFKYNDLHDELCALNLSPEETALFIHSFPDNPVCSDYPADIQKIVNLANAVFSYLLWMTEISFTLQGSAQSGMFYIGMHKGMIFILDKIIGPMRALTYTGTDGHTYSVAPTFENFQFNSIQTAKAELIALCKEAAAAIPSLKLDTTILPRICDLPDVNVVNNTVNFA